MRERPGQEHHPVDDAGDKEARESLMGAMDGVRSRDDFVEAVRTAERYLGRHPGDAEVRDALQELRDREERRMLLRWYAPCLVILYVAIGYASGRWGPSFMAAVVVGMPASLAAFGVFRGFRALTRGRAPDRAPGRGSGPGDPAD